MTGSRYAVPAFRSFFEKITHVSQGIALLSLCCDKPENRNKPGSATDQVQYPEVGKGEPAD